MADQSAEELLLDVRVSEASKLYKFYLNNEKKLLGTAGVVTFLTVWELVGNVLQIINPMFMSAPSLILKAGIDMFSSGEIYNDLYVSGIELFWGYCPFSPGRDPVWHHGRLVQEDELYFRSVHQCHERDSSRRASAVW